jgi:uncharacterized SAM-binding protein YcdF (DUF218 family)
VTRTRWLLAGLGGLVAAWAIGAWALFLRPHGDEALPADAVVVLAGDPRRLPVGLRLVREGVAPVLVVSRDRREDVTLDDDICADRVPVRHICFEGEPYRTAGEARAIARLVREHGWKRIDVVTSRFHLFRAGILVRRCVDGDVQMVAAPNPPVLELAGNVLLETLKLADALVLRRGC